ncbi:endothelial lipase [Anastrepha obliqua]|uniref:endothelial lipase n=1 Tax=Anastrepha obliqua TaxID=95512 RepID=UPI0024093247|nr:endothelial lipase [Anastrepha obliqua]
MRLVNAFLTFLLSKINVNLTWANPIQGIFDPNCFVVNSDCPNENVTFWLYTKATADKPVQLDPLNLKQTDFPIRQPVKILIHGYTGHRDFAPNTYIRPVLLQREDVYVISSDYGPLVREPCYFSAVENLPQASRCLAQLINNLVSQDIVRNEDIHVIGFSLGAQVAGQTANYLTKKLPHITGLDPAKPLFITVGNDRRLSKDDADFVDVIHTDVMGRGLMYPMGHIDFYPNFGYVQPGCEVEAEPGSCNHDRAPRFYAESINSKHEFWSSQCPNWLYFVLNLCNVNSNDAMMGYYVDKSLSGQYFLKTSNSTPFALGRNNEKVSEVQSNWRENYDLDMLSEEACNQLLLCRFLRYGTENAMILDSVADEVGFKKKMEVINDKNSY